MAERLDKPITLVIPPSTFLADERVFPTLGILKVASVLRKEKVPLNVVDLSGISNYTEALIAALEQTGSETVGLTATTPQLPATFKLVDAVRQFSPKSKIILGGPHATLTQTAYRLDSGRGGRGTTAFKQLEQTFDVIVAGDGEKAIFEALSPNSPQLIDASFLKSPLFLQRGTLDDYPYPARDLIDMNSYHYEIDGVPAQSVIAQLGCPFKCGFCGGRDSDTFRVARSRSEESVLDEVEQVFRLTGRPGFMFYDDELNIQEKKLMPLLEGLVKLQEKLKVEMRFRGFVKAERFTPEQARAMYRAGFRVILSGVESGSDEILTAMQKNTTRETNSDWVRYSHEAGLRVKALMSIGHPGERESTINESLQWVKDNLKPNLDDVDWTIITQYPGSPYFDRSTLYDAKNNVWVYTVAQTGSRLFSQDINFAEKADYYKGVPGDYTSFIWTDYLSPQRSVYHRDRVERVSRKFLNLRPITSVAAKQFEHSMGQRLPEYILKSVA